MTERHASPVLRNFPPDSMHTAPLSGVEAAIYDRLWRAIIDGKLKPGSKLREEIIGEAFDVSRTVVRKVLIIMEQEGIVDLPPNRGAYVASPTPQDAESVYEIFLMVVVHIVRELAASPVPISAAHRAMLDQHIAAQANAEAKGDFATARLLAGEFALLLAVIHGNRSLADLLSKVVLRYFLVMALYQVGYVREERARFHRELLTLILAGNAAEAVERIKAAFVESKQSLRLNAAENEEDLRAILTGRAAELVEPAKRKRGRPPKAV